MRWLADLHRRVTGGDEVPHDRGVTMVELIVAMIIMTICGSIFTGAMVSLFRSTNAAQAFTDSSQQTNQAFQRLDKMVRYAAAISTPAASTGTGTTGNWYVELSDTTSGTEECTQLSLDRVSQTLKMRSWTASSPSTTLTPWRAIASSMTNGLAASGSADQPFVLQRPGPTADSQQLTITLVARSGPIGDRKTSRSSTTFAALNSAVPQASTSICTQVTRP